MPNKLIIIIAQAFAPRVKKVSYVKSCTILHSRLHDKNTIGNVSKQGVYQVKFQKRLDQRIFARHNVCTVFECT